MAVNIIESTGQIIETPLHQRSDKSAQRNVFAEEGEAAVICPRFIYLKLGNWTDNKEVTEEHFVNEHNEYEKFMMDMNRFFETGIDKDNISVLDEYLGSLGVEIEYPFQDDGYQGKFAELKSGIEPRNVIFNFSDVDYNVIAGIDGIDYNVNHDPTYVIE